MICRVDRRDCRSSEGIDCMAGVRGLGPEWLRVGVSPNAEELGTVGFTVIRCPLYLLGTESNIQCLKDVSGNTVYGSILGDGSILFKFTWFVQNIQFSL